MAGTVVFALTEQQAAALLKLSSGSNGRDFTESERVAFFALARRGLVRGSPGAGDARLTRRGMIASLLAAELPEASSSSSSRRAVAA